MVSCEPTGRTMIHAAGAARRVPQPPFATVAFRQQRGKTLTQSGTQTVLMHLHEIHSSQAAFKPSPIAQLLDPDRMQPKILRRSQCQPRFESGWCSSIECYGTPRATYSVYLLFTERSCRWGFKVRRRALGPFTNNSTTPSMRLVIRVPIEAQSAVRVRGGSRISVSAIPRWRTSAKKPLQAKQRSRSWAGFYSHSFTTS